MSFSISARQPSSPAPAHGVAWPSPGTLWMKGPGGLCRYDEEALLRQAGQLADDNGRCGCLPAICAKS